MTVTVFRATTEHVSDVAVLFDGYRQSYGQASDLDGATSFIAARLQQGDSAVFLARDRMTAVGFTQLYPSYSSVAMRRMWILNDLFVVKSARRTGVATSLMEQAQRFAADTLAVRLALATAIGNQPAQTLYEKIGWVRDEAFVHYNYEL